MHAKNEKRTNTVQKAVSLFQEKQDNTEYELSALSTVLKKVVKKKSRKENPQNKVSFLINADRKKKIMRKLLRKACLATSHCK